MRGVSSMASLEAFLRGVFQELLPQDAHQHGVAELAVHQTLLPQQPSRTKPHFS